MTHFAPKRLASALAGMVLVFLLQAAEPAQSADMAELRLASIFGDNMVLQQQQRVPVWGWAAPGATVTVKFSGQTRSTRADANGRWVVKLAKLKASAEPQMLVIESGETRTFTNILVGDGKALLKFSHADDGLVSKDGKSAQ